MSRSLRKSSIISITTAKSEKQDKRLANRSHRRYIRQALKKGSDELPLLREVSNVWGFSKDGKQYFHHLDGFERWPWWQWVRK